MATIKIVVSVAFLVLVECRPPVQQHPGGRGVPLQKETNDTSDWNLGLEYNRLDGYLTFEMTFKFKTGC